MRTAGASPGRCGRSARRRDVPTNGTARWPPPSHPRTKEHAMPRGKEHHYELRVTWTGGAAGGTTDYKTYSREYRADFPGKPSIAGSSDPAFHADPDLHHPEDKIGTTSWREREWQYG